MGKSQHNPLDTLEEEQKYKVFSAFYAAEEDWTLEEGIFYKLYHHGYKDKAKLAEVLAEKKSVYNRLYSTGRGSICIPDYLQLLEKRREICGGVREISFG